MSAHKQLCDRDILHSDISAGNILLSDPESRPLDGPGFVTDFDLAQLLSAPRSLLSLPGMSSPYQPGIQVFAPPITVRVFCELQYVYVDVVLWQGTAQFMAVEILEYNHGLITGKTNSPVLHAVHHDLEAFCVLFIYSIVIRSYHALDSPVDRRSYRQSLEDYFGKQSFGEIAKARRQLYGLDEQSLSPLLRNEILLSLADDLMTLSILQNPAPRLLSLGLVERDFITHEKMLDAINRFMKVKNWPIP